MRTMHGVRVGCGRERQPIEIDVHRDIRILEAMERKNHSKNSDKSDEEEESPDEEEDNLEDVDEG